MASLYLVACSKRKASSACAAQDLYRGDLFRAARAYVESRSAPWLILSAKYGLLEPQTPIAPYDFSLRQLTPLQRFNWATYTLNQLNRYAPEGTTLVFLAGALYRDPLLERLATWECPIETPLKGLFLGQQKPGLNKTPKRRHHERRPTRAPCARDEDHAPHQRGRRLHDL